MTGFVRQRWVPDWVLAPGLGVRRARVARVGRDLGDDAAFEAVKRGQSVVVELAPELTLRRTLRLPAKAGKRAAQVADVELRQSLPLGGQNMVWRLDQPVLRGDQLQVDAYVLKMAHIQTIKAALERRGATLAQLRLAGLRGVPPFLDDRRAALRGAGLWGVLTVAVPLAVLGPQLWADWQGLQAARAALPAANAELAQLTQTAVDRRAAQTETAQESGAHQADLALLDAARGRTWLVAELTRLIPTDIWLSELAITGTDMRLSGEASGDVVALVTALQKQPWVKRAQLDGPVYFDSFSQSTRFDLNVVLEGPQVAE